MNRTTTIVIVNYRTAELVTESLRSIEPERLRAPELHVIVVDNASGDGSVQRLMSVIEANGWHDWVTLLEAHCNGGFSAGTNIGIRSRQSNFYLLLNPDTLIRSGAIEALLTFMHDHPRVGIAGSSLEGPDGFPQGSARRCPTPLSELDAGARIGPLSRMLSRWAVPILPDDGGHPMQCDWVSGAAMCVRREVFEEVGLLDEGYFLYFEELDLCERARRAGWEVWLVPQSRIVHFEGGSTGQNGSGRPACWYDSRRRFFLKRHGVLGLVCADVLWGLGHTVSAARQAFGRVTNTRRSNPPQRAAARQLLLGDAKAIVSGEAFRIARRA